MALPPTAESIPTSAAAAPGGAAPVYRSALVLLATLFFMWGFITVINNTLLPHLRSVFDLNYTQTTLIESVWFIAYFVARSEEHTSELQSLMRISYAVFCLKKNN